MEVKNFDETDILFASVCFGINGAPGRRILVDQFLGVPRLSLVRNHMSLRI